MRVAVGITTYCPTEIGSVTTFTKRLMRCLPSVASLRRDGHTVDIHVVDDGSDPKGYHRETLIKLCADYGAAFSFHKKNYGVSAAKNTSLRYFSGGDYDIYILLDDDTEVIGDLPSFYDMRMEQTGVSHAGFFEPIVGGWITREYATLAGAPVVVPDHTLGACLVFRKVMLEKVGAFRLFPERWGWEHVDWTIRAVRAGLLPFPLDFVGSDRYLKLQDTNKTSTISRSERIRMSAINKAFMLEHNDTFLPL